MQKKEGIKKDSVGVSCVCLKKLINKYLTDSFTEHMSLCLNSADMNESSLSSSCTDAVEGGGGLLHIWRRVSTTIACMSGVGRRAESP